MTSALFRSREPQYPPKRERLYGNREGLIERDIAKLRSRKIAQHIAQIQGRNAPGLDGRTTRHQSYAISQCKRKRIDEILGWIKTVAV